MTDKNKTRKSIRRNKNGNNAQTRFYGGLKSNNELYFQMASLFKEVTKGNQPLAGQWMGRIMASQGANIQGQRI